MSDAKEPQVTKTASLLESTDLIFEEANGALSELDQIMSDIEELQQEISGEMGAPSVQAEAVVSEPSLGESPASMEPATPMEPATSLEPTTSVAPATSVELVASVESGEWLEVLESAPSVKLMEVVEVVDPLVASTAPVEAEMELVPPVEAATESVPPVEAAMESVPPVEAATESVPPVQAQAPIVTAAPAEKVEAAPPAPAALFEPGDEIDVLLAGPPARGGASLEETLVHLKHEESVSSGGLLDQIAQVKSSASEKNSGAVEEFKMKEVHSGETTQKEADGSLTMTLTGNMTLTLKYEFDGQEVVVGFKDHFLNVQLADGTEFKIPVSRSGLKRKAA